MYQHVVSKLATEFIYNIYFAEEQSQNRKYEMYARHPETATCWLRLARHNNRKGLYLAKPYSSDTSLLAHRNCYLVINKSKHTLCACLWFKGMKNNYLYVKDNIIGFGIDTESKEKDWEINKLSEQNIEELPWEYRKAYIRYSPWLPSKDMLHISELGCLVYIKPFITNTANNNTVLVNKFGKTMYYYIMKLFDEKLTYKDIRVTLHETFEKYFQGISTLFVPFKEYGTITICDDNELEYGTRYIFSEYEIYLADSLIGLRNTSNTYWYVIDIQDDWRSDLCYLAYRANIDIKEILECI